MVREYYNGIFFCLFRAHGNGVEFDSVLRI